MQKLLALLLVAGIGTAVASPPGGGHGPGHRGPPPLHKMVLDHADELGLTDETVAAIEALLQAARPEHEALREEMKTAREAVRTLVEGDSPDRAAVVAAIETLGAIQTDIHLQHTGLMLDLRELLTPEQWEALKEMRPERARGPSGSESKDRPEGRWRGDR